jgi:hypothetical protein
MKIMIFAQLKNIQSKIDEEGDVRGRGDHLDLCVDVKNQTKKSKIIIDSPIGKNRLIFVNIDKNGLIRFDRLSKKSSFELN